MSRCQAACQQRPTECSFGQVCHFRTSQVLTAEYYKKKVNVFAVILLFNECYRICKNAAGEINYKDLLKFLDIKQITATPSVPTDIQVCCTNSRFNLLEFCYQ